MKGLEEPDGRMKTNSPEQHKQKGGQEFSQPGSFCALFPKKLLHGLGIFFRLTVFVPWCHWGKHHAGKGKLC
jgi:hypothetical protein